MNLISKMSSVVLALLFVSLIVPDAYADGGCLFPRLRTRMRQPICCPQPVVQICPRTCEQNCQTEYCAHLAICERFKNSPTDYARCRFLACQGLSICQNDCRCAGSVPTQWMYRNQTLGHTAADCDFQHANCTGTPRACNDQYFECMKTAYPTP